MLPWEEGLAQLAAALQRTMPGVSCQQWEEEDGEGSLGAARPLGYRVAKVECRVAKRTEIGENGWREFNHLHGHKYEQAANHLEFDHVTSGTLVAITLWTGHNCNSFNATVTLNSH